MNGQNPKRALKARLQKIALIVVAIAVPVSLLAAAILWVTQGIVAAAMLQGTAFAVVAAYPVWRAYSRMLHEEHNRKAAQD